MRSTPEPLGTGDPRPEPSGTTEARHRRTLAGLSFLIALILALTTGACSTLGYFGQAALGQARIMCSRRSIDRWIADPSTSTELRQRLELVRSIRGFAVDALDLSDQGYQTYVELPRMSDGSRPRAVVWNVFAAPELSLQPVTWCFPVAGCVLYRGYFQRPAAEIFAEELRSEGFDVSVGGAAAYSTLGWFSDPLLSTVIESPPLDIAALIFHELAHLAVYFPGDTELNESFATVVENEGVRRWIESGRAGPADAEARTQRQKRRDHWNALLLRTRDELESVFSGPGDNDTKREVKSEVLLRASRDCQELFERSPGDKACDLNNADLVAVGAYHGLTSAFESLLADVNGDLPAFYDQVSTLEPLSIEERRRQLAADSQVAGDP